MSAAKYVAKRVGTTRRKFRLFLGPVWLGDYFSREEAVREAGIRKAFFPVERVKIVEETSKEYQVVKEP